MLSGNPDTINVPPIPALVTQQPQQRLIGNNHRTMTDYEVQEMLSYLDPDMDYDEWVKVGMALHAGSYSVDSWDEWSRRGGKYESGVCLEKWGSFSAHGAGKVGMGTLIHMAREAGWTRNAMAYEAAQPIEFIAPVTLQGQPIPPREWLVPEWIPMLYTTALYGDGGTGKSLLAMQLMTAAATGKHWLGQPVKQVKVLGVFCEDDPTELHRRQGQINYAYECNFSDLGNMRWYSGVGADNTLVAFESGHESDFTSLYHQIEKEALEFGAQLIVIDTAADTFGGNENARRDVRIFINRLNQLALQINGAVVLCAHPSVAGMATGRGDGGNTAWNNSVRSRLYLHRPEPDKDQPQLDTNIRLLSRKKSNYSATNDELSLLWQNGVFIAFGATGSPGDALTRTNREKAVEEAFLKAMDEMEAQGRTLSSAKTSGNYAPKVLFKSPICQGFGKKELEDAMERLFNRRQIKNEAYGRGSRPARKIVKVEKSPCA